MLRAVLVVAFGPALTACLEAPAIAPIGVPIVTAAPTAAPVGTPLSATDDWAPGFLGDQAAACTIVPAMPQSFTARRVFFSFFNTIVFADRKGVEFGFVESWFMDLKNPFGFPGATFYLKAAPAVGDNGVWNINGPQPNQNNAWTHPANEALAQQAAQDQFGRTPTMPPGKTGPEDGPGFWASLFVGGSATHRLAAFMVGKHGTAGTAQSWVGEPFADEMTVRDCLGQATSRAVDGQLMMRGAMDARYYQRKGDTDNMLLVEDLGQPPSTLVTVLMKEPCTPFPPFCANMGMWNWFMHGNEWEGHLAKPNLAQAMGGLDGVTIAQTGGEAEDMRFLTLYTMYSFSNTRWSPFMTIFWWVLFGMPLLCCCWKCCCPSCYGSGPAKEEKKSEETEKLMQTMETAEPPMKTEPPAGFLACCSRRGGRGVGLSN